MERPKGRSPGRHRAQGQDGRARPPADDAWEPLDRAIAAFRRGATGAFVTVHNDVGPSTSLPVSVFLRGAGEATLEKLALDTCRGRVLDVGAAAGAVAVELQARNLDVTALDPLPEAVALMRDRGVVDARRGDVFEFGDPRPYETVLLLMNGSMVAGTLDGLERLLAHLGGLLAPGGQILMDSTDLRDEGEPLSSDGRYVGETHYQLEFEGHRGPPFPQLFVDPHTLSEVAGRVGLEVRVLGGAEGKFLARLTVAEEPH